MGGGFRFQGDLSNSGLSVGFELQIVGTGVLDGPSPTHRGSLSDLCYSRTVEDASPYESNLFVGFKQSAKLQFKNIGEAKASPILYWSFKRDQTPNPAL
jgi:hypothetical protein